MRDAYLCGIHHSGRMFRDYLCVLLADCMSEPIGSQLARTNHEASLLATQVLLGWTATSDAFVKAVSA